MRARKGVFYHIMRYLIISNNGGMLVIYRGALIRELLKSASVTACVPHGGEEELKKLGCDIVYADVDRRGINPISDLKLYRQYKKIIKEVNPDAVITYSIKPNIYGGYACRKLGVPYYLHVQGLGSAFYRKGLKTVVSVMYRAAAKKAKAVFFENEGNRDLFVNKKIIKKDQAVVFSGAGVDLDAFSLTPMPEGDGVKFAFVSRIMKEKGVDELFYAAKKLKSEFGERFDLSIAGIFEDSYEQVVNELHEKGIIKYLGFVNDVASLYRSCDAVVLPSYHEGMSNVLLEGAAIGRVLVTTDVYGCREAVVSEESGLICPVRDGEALYSAMKRVCLMSKSERETMGKRGRAHVEKNFDRNEVVRKTIEVIK